MNLIHGFVELIFGIALYINAILFIPQALNIIKNKTAAGLSLTTFLGFLLIQFTIVLHAIFAKDYILLAGYLFSMMTCGFVVALIIKYKKYSQKK